MKHIFAFAVVMLVLAGTQLFAASDYLLEIKNIKGEVVKTSTKSVNGRVSLNGLPPGQPVLRCDIQWNGTSYTVYVANGIVSPRDAASGLPTGKRMHKPFVLCANGEVFDFDTKEQAITKAKELDKSTPLLLQITKTTASFTYQKIEW